MLPGQDRFGPTLPAGHSGSVAGPWCCRSRSAPRSRPVVLPTCCAAGRLPTCCPWCCRPVNSRPVAPRSRPVTREALPARGAAGQDRPHAPGPVVLPTCCACRPVADRVAPRSRPVTREALPARGAAGQDRPHAPGPVVLPTCCAAGRLPTCCPRVLGRLPHAPGRSLGKRCRPVVLPGQDRPHAPGPVTRKCCRPGCRRAALPARQLPAGCPHAPGRSLGKHCRPVVLPVKIGPTLPARGAADVLPVSRLPTCCPWCCPARQLFYMRRNYGAPESRRMIGTCRAALPFLTPSTGISPSDSVTPICITVRRSVTFNRGGANNLEEQH